MKNPLAGILLLCWFLLFYLLGLYWFNIRISVSDSFESVMPDFSAFFSDTKNEMEYESISDKTTVPNKSIEVLPKVADSVVLAKVTDTLGADSLYPLLGPESKVDTSSQRILLCGDSMAESLFYPFFNYCKWSNFQFKLLAIRGTASPFWVKTDTLVNTIRKFRPTLVLFSLGANEITVPALMRRKKLYRQIIQQFDSLPYIFITTPVWNGDTIYTQMMQSLVPANQLFISQGIPLPRQRDGAHPDMRGQRIWADTLAKWIVYKSKYPVYFQLKKPLHFKQRFTLQQPVVESVNTLGKDSTQRKPRKRLRLDSTKSNKPKLVPDSLQPKP